MKEVIIGIFAFVVCILMFFIIVVIGTLPMWLLWNWLAPTYFTGLPAAWLNIPFWHMFGLIYILMVIGGLISGTSSKAMSSIGDGVNKALKDND